MNLALFEPTLINQRWTMAYYEELAETRFSFGDSTQFDQPHITVTVTEKKQTILFAEISESPENRAVPCVLGK